MNFINNISNRFKNIMKFFTNTIAIIPNAINDYAFKIFHFLTPKDNIQTKDFALIIITTSNKIEGNIHFKEDDDYESDVSLDNVKNLINESRYFILENEDIDIIAEAQTRREKPDFTRENNFIIKITGQGTIDIGNYPTKSWLRDNITSENCRIEEILRLLDANIAEKFVPAI